MSEASKRYYRNHKSVLNAKATERYRQLRGRKKMELLRKKRGYSKTSYELRREQILAYWNRFYATSPWMGSFKSAKARCQRRTHEAYERYGGRGIKFLLTISEVKWMWLRDGVNLVDPTLDRIDNDGHYEFNNCRFIERSENGRKGAN